MSYELTGQIHRINPTATVRDFAKREFVLRYAENPQYPQLVSLQFVKDKCSELDKFVPGATVTVSFNIQGREWTDPQGNVKYFNTLQAWKIVPAAGAATPPPPPTAFDAAQFTNDDDLPF